LVNVRLRTNATGMHTRQHRSGMPAFRGVRKDAKSFGYR
jgi:hypothetical protein